MKNRGTRRMTISGRRPGDRRESCAGTSFGRRTPGGAGWIPIDARAQDLQAADRRTPGGRVQDLRADDVCREAHQGRLPSTHVHRTDSPRRTGTGRTPISGSRTVAQARGEAGRETDVGGDWERSEYFERSWRPTRVMGEGGDVRRKTASLDDGRLLTCFLGVSRDSRYA